LLARTRAQTTQSVVAEILATGPELQAASSQVLAVAMI